MKKYKLIGLQIFAEGDGGDGAGGTDAEGMTAAQRAEAEAGIAALDQELSRRRPMESKQYGIRKSQPKAAGETPQAEENAPKTKTLEQEWDEARKGKFKDLYGKDVKEAVQRRLKGRADAEQQLQTLSPALNTLMKNYGVQDGDIGKLVEAIQSDDHLIEEEAMKRGMSVDAYREFSKLEQEHNARMEQEARDRETREREAKFNSYWQQSEQLKEIYPSFDLSQELENDNFLRMIETGVPVRTAFEAIHMDELQPQAMRYAGEKAQKQMAQTMAANARRPAEGALGHRGQVPVTVDMDKFTLKDFAEIKRRAARGETIQFE